MIASALAASAGITGLPFTRSYPLDEIGSVPRGARLGFDSFGRLSLANEGVYAVLNDTVWLNLARADDDQEEKMANIVPGPDGKSYYGGRGSWGLAQAASDGRLTPVSLRPPQPPAWTKTAYFEDIIPMSHGTFFGSWGGVIFWDAQKRESLFFEQRGSSRIFRVGDIVFLSAFDQPILRIDPVQRALVPVAGTESIVPAAVELWTRLDDSSSLLALTDGRLMTFDGHTLAPWAAQARHDLRGRISALQELADGGLAVAITGKGVFLLSPAGELRASLTASPYQLVTSLACREPGVLWVAGEDAIEKVLYGSPMTNFGERLGLPVWWPMLQPWQDRMIVMSDGKLYESQPATTGVPTRFVPFKDQPEGGAWAVAAGHGTLLVGSRNRVFAAGEDRVLRPLVDFKDLTHLAMQGPDRCFLIGTTEIGMLEWRDGKWTEAAPRIPGVHYPAIVHSRPLAAWIEMGPEGVARLSCEDGKLQLRRLDTPWSGSPWINLGFVDDVVTVTGPAGGRLYYDDRRQQWTDALELSRELDRSPYWILRVKKAESGVLWAGHSEGLVTYTPRAGGGYDMDSSSFDLSNDRFPFVHMLPGDDVWISTSRSLHHVEPELMRRGGEHPQPMLVSVVDTRNNEELFHVDSRAPGVLQLDYHRNNLAFRPFSGSYAWRRPGAYQVRLNESGPWTQLEAGSTLSVSELREGRHLLELRTFGSPDATARFDFEIRSPWYRTAAAYSLYVLGGIGIFFGAVRAANYFTRRHNLMLEQLVQERTRELERTMEKLNEETRHAATLAERNRLAGEIHDSLQQGLSGAIMQLDTTLKMNAVAAAVRTRLNVVRNMLSFTRHEVQHAVWDMETPLLEGTELGDALRKLTALIGPGTAEIQTRVAGVPAALPGATKHHLLRIAQEATTNAVRHARASRITIDLIYSADRVELTVADDGVGFVPDDAQSKTAGHFGLRGLRARAKKLGAALAIDSAPGEGTSIRLVIPLYGQPLPSPHAEVAPVRQDSHPVS